MQTGSELKEIALDRVERKHVRWIDIATDVVRDIAQDVDAFTTDRVEYELEVRGIEPPNEPRAFGALMLRAARAGWVSKTDQVAPSVIPRNHRRPKSIWKSRLRA